jgi:hypothetical protein
LKKLNGALKKQWLKNTLASSFVLAEIAEEAGSGSFWSSGDGDCSDEV